MTVEGIIPAPTPELRRAESGHLVIFDRAESKPWEEKLYRGGESLDGRAVTVWGA